MDVADAFASHVAKLSVEEMGSAEAVRSHVDTFIDAHQKEQEGESAQRAAHSRNIGEAIARLMRESTVLDACSTRRLSELHQTGTHSSSVPLPPHTYTRAHDAHVPALASTPFHPAPARVSHPHSMHPRPSISVHYAKLDAELMAYISTRAVDGYASTGWLDLTSLGSYKPFMSSETGRHFKPLTHSLRTRGYIVRIRLPTNIEVSWEAVEDESLFLSPALIDRWVLPSLTGCSGSSTASAPAAEDTAASTPASASVVSISAPARAPGSRAALDPPVGCRVS